MDCGAAEAADLPRMQQGAALETAVKTLSDAGRETAVVTDAEGWPTGRVSPSKLMEAL